MPWFSKEIGDGMQAFGPTNRLQQVFWQLTLQAAQRGELQLHGGPSLWSKYDLERNVVTVYISPEGEQVARALDGFAECQKPDVDDIGLLYGNASDWARHYPDGPRSRRFGLE